MIQGTSMRQVFQAFCDAEFDRARQHTAGYAVERADHGTIRITRPDGTAMSVPTAA